MQSEDAVALYIFGLVSGLVITLLIQWFGRRKARQAVAALTTDGKREITLLSNENERQSGQIDRLQERLAVLERLAIDPSERTARAIEALR